MCDSLVPSQDVACHRAYRSLSSYEDWTVGTAEGPCLLQAQGALQGGLGTSARLASSRREGLGRFGGPRANLPREVCSHTDLVRGP